MRRVGAGLPLREAARRRPGCHGAARRGAADPWVLKAPLVCFRFSAEVKGAADLWVRDTPPSWPQARWALAKLQLLLLGPRKAPPLSRAARYTGTAPPRRLSKEEVQGLARAGRLPWNPADVRGDSDDLEDIDDVAQRAQKRAAAAAAGERKWKRGKVRPWDAVGSDRHPPRPSRPKQS
jgi:hypothetical protein